MEEKKKPSLMQTFLEFFYGNFIVLLLGLIQVPLLTRILSTDQYGRTSLFLPAATIIYNLAMVGMDQSYIRYFYKEGVDRRRLMKKCLSVPVCIISVLAVAYALFSRPFNLFLFGADSPDITMLVVGYTFTAVFERLFFLNIRMEQNGKLYSNLYILSKVLNLSFVVLFFWWLGDDFRILLWANTLSLAIVTGFVVARYAVRGRGGYAVRGRGRGRAAGEESGPGAGTLGEPEAGTAACAEASGEPVAERPGELGTGRLGGVAVSSRELLRYGAPFILAMLIEQIQASCDKTFLRLFSTWSEQGIYNSAMQIMTILLTFKAAFVAFWAPVAMERYERRGGEESRAFFRAVYGKVRLLCVLAAFCLILFRGLIVLFLGEKYRGAVAIIPFLTLMPILSIMYEITSQGIKFKGKIRYFNYASVVSILFNVAGNLLLVPRLGGKGAAISTGLTYILYFAVGTYFSEKCYRVGYDFRKTAFHILVLGVYALEASFVQALIPNILCGLAGMTAVCLADRGEIAQMAGFVREALRKRRARG